MKKILLILFCFPLLFITCKKEKSEIEIESSNITINKVWELSMKSTYLGQGDQYHTGTYMDSLTGSIYTGQINYVNSSSIIVSNDTIFPALSASYSSRVWSISENQVIIDTYYDANGFSFNVSQHNFTRHLDTLIINFQSGNVKKFVINELTANKLQITSIPERNYFPIFDVNGIYQDTVLMNLTSDNYIFDEAQ